MALNLQLPEQPDSFDFGLQPGALVVNADLDLDCVRVTFLGEMEIVLSTRSTIDLVMRLFAALNKLQGGSE